jgi:hypothetical protein
MLGYENTLILQERVLEFWSPAPLLEGQQGKVIDPPTGLAKPAEGVLVYTTDSSIGSELEEAHYCAQGADLQGTKGGGSPAMWGRFCFRGDGGGALSVFYHHAHRGIPPRW